MHTLWNVAGAVALMASAVQADEVWTSELGDVIYEDEIEGQAILSFPTENGARGRMYFPGLAGNFDDRSVHVGYWILPGPAECASDMTALDGWTSGDWGRVTIAFDGPAFPTSWTAIFGRCFDALEYPVRGEVN